MTANSGRLFHHAMPFVNTDVGSEASLICYHCGLPVASDTDFAVEIEQQRQRMCCVGCESVAQTIINAGLVDFYRHRTDFSEKVDLAALPRISPPGSLVVLEPTGSAPAFVELQLYLTGLRCAACAWLAERALEAISGVDRVAVNLTTRSARVRVDSNRVSASTIIDALARVGLGAEPVEHEARLLVRRNERRTQLLEFGVAALCMMQVMMLVVPIYLADPDEISYDARQLMAWAAWLLTLPVLLFSARPIFLSAWRTAMRRTRHAYLGMDVPVALALVLTFAASTVALITQSGQHYFDAISMFVFLLLGARWIESALRRRTAENIDRLSNARPLECVILRHYPVNEEGDTIRADQLAVDDVVSIRPGDIVPADAVIVRGESEIDEALMTGESRPVARRVGDPLFGGTVNTSSPLVVRVTATGEQTLLARLGKMVETSLMYRPQFHGIADHVARWLVPATLLASAAAAALWWQLDQSRAVEIAIVVLVVTCPCAFALAAPTALASALGRLTREGLLVTRGHLVETLASATDVVFDKTGTLTTGEMVVTSMHSEAAISRDVLQIAVALERGTAHPVARAITAHAQQHLAELGAASQIPVATSLISQAGAGVEAAVDGRTYRLGTPAFAVPRTMLAPPALPRSGEFETEVILCSVDNAQPVVYVCFRLADPIRSDAKRCVARLQASGLRVHMLSGDASGVVHATAEALGIRRENVRATQTPSQKQDYVKQLCAAGDRVVAVGDGVNDAPMLATATGSIGLAEGSTLTRVAADAVLEATRERMLTALVNAFALARRTARVIRQNLLWAFAYNLIAVPLAFAGKVTPLMAAIGMAASSLVVVLNASRLTRAPTETTMMNGK